MNTTDGQLYSDMQAFVAVAECQGFARAAEQLGTEPPNVSRVIARLEARLGVRLFNRTTRRVSLTSSGAGYLEHCRRTISAFDGAREFISAEQGGVTGILRISIPMTFALIKLGPILSAFAENHPEVQVHSTVTDDLLDLTAHRIDVAIRLGTAVDDKLHSRLLGKTERILCASPAYVGLHGSPKSPRDLVRHRCMAFSGRPNSNAWTLTSGARKEQVAIRPVQSANNSLVLRDLAGSGVGIAPMALYVAEPLLASGHLVRVLPRWSLGSLDIRAVYLSSRNLSPKVRAFIDLCARSMHRG